MNSTQVWFFVLSAYFDVGLLKYLLFLLMLLLYASIVCANVLLILVICMNRSLHEPMYIFLVSLFVNELYGSSGLFPFLLVQLLSDLHRVSFSLCYLQIFCLYSYGCVEIFNLAVMSYDRYLAICRPLQYASHMTARRVACLTVMSWLFPCAAIVVLMSLSSRLRLCGNVIDRIYCGNYSIVKLSCSDTTVNNVYGLIYLVLSVMVPLLLILISYAKILHVCFSGSRRTRQKSISTCSPHVAALLNFTCGVCFQVLQSRFSMRHVPRLWNVFLSLYFLTCQPLFTPVVYGLNMSKIYSTCKQMIRT